MLNKVNAVRHVKTVFLYLAESVPFYSAVSCTTRLIFFIFPLQLPRYTESVGGSDAVRFDSPGTHS